MRHKIEWSAPHAHTQPLAIITNTTITMTTSATTATNCPYHFICGRYHYDSYLVGPCINPTTTTSTTTTTTTNVTTTANLLLIEL